MIASKEKGTCSTTAGIKGLHVSKLWPLERYARYVVQGHVASVYPLEEGRVAWQHFSSKDGAVLNLSLVESNHLMVSNGNEILESVTLWETQRWLKAVAKGDSILFIFRQKEENRRFRIQLASLSSEVSSIDVCQDVVTCLSQFLSIMEVNESGTGGGGGNSELSQPLSDSQMSYENSQLISIPPLHRVDVDLVQSKEGQCNSQELPDTSAQQVPPTNETTTVSIGTIAQELVEMKKPLGRAYAETDLPTEQLSAFIRLCLSDSNFPGFVEVVEKELNQIQSP